MTLSKDRFGLLSIFLCKNGYASPRIKPVVTTKDTRRNVMKEKLFGVLQRIGRSFMLPIAVLPVAGLLLGIGGSFTNPQMIEAYGLSRILGQGTILHTILEVMKEAGDIVFANLPLLFAIGVAIGMAKQEKEVAALSATIAFFVMHASIHALLTLQGSIVDGQVAEHVLSGTIASVVGIQSLQMGVFGGILVGLGVAVLHNRFYQIRLPQTLSFFGGTRFVPIVSAAVYVFVGIAMVFVWPPIQRAIYSLGELVRNSGYMGTWIYGIIERGLIPFGLHHVFYIPFWQTGVGGSMEISGTLVEGAQNIFFAQLADPSTKVFSVEATRFMAGKFPFMMFGLPGAALAMYQCARKRHKQAVGGLLLSAAITSVLTGITEPLEFTFLFVAPMLYIVHCVFAGFSFMLMHICKVGVGMTFSGGFIDFLLFGVLQGNAKTHWIWILIVGVFYFFLYYIVFTILIRKFRLKTPGREETHKGDIRLYTRADVKARGQKIQSKEESFQRAAKIVEGLGEQENISDVDCCITRLRITVKDGSLVKEDLLRETGAAGVIRKGTGIQIVYGPQVTVIRSQLEAYMNRLASGKEPVVLTESGQQEKKQVKGEPATGEGGQQTKGETVTGEGGKITQKEQVYSPLTGKLISLKEVEDGVFSQGMAGFGCAIEPLDGKVYAPFDGSVSMVFETKHAMGLVSEYGAEVLIHMGIDTVELKGQYFHVHVKQGQRIRRGDLLAEFDLKRIREAGYATITPVVVTNSEDYGQINIVDYGKVKHNKKIMELKKE